MPILYDRKETKEEIIIVFKYRMIYILILLAFLLSAFIGFDPRWEPLVFSAFAILMVLWVMGRWAANSEIRQAAKKGEVKISGSGYSFKNPLTVRIKK